MSETVKWREQFEAAFPFGMRNIYEALGDTYDAPGVVTFKVMIIAVEEPEIELQECGY
jgi:hypothetical protein